jgi:hypothetical protein
LGYAHLPQLIGGPGVGLLVIWAGYEQSRLTVLKTAYASAYTVTRDKVPNLK